MKRLVALLLICLLAAPAGAQGQPAPKPARVRITGANTYEVTGVMRLEEDRVFGNAATADSRFVQFRGSDGGRLETILRPGKRLTGKALAIADGLLEFVPEQDTGHLYVPLDAVVKIEVSRVSGSRTNSLAAGLYTGAGIFLTTWIALIRFCEDRCGDRAGQALFTLGIGAAIAAGAMVGRKVRGQRWEVLSADELDRALRETP